MKKLIFGIGRFLGATGRATVALVGVCGVVAALANYTMTQGAGTNFGSIVVSTVHYVQMLVCDPTTPANCGGVKAGNTAVVADVAQVVSDPNVVAAINAPVPAGTNLIGRLGIDQTTPGTTNLVAIGPVGSGVQATAPRMTLATDSPGIVTLGQTTKSASVPVTIASDQQAGTFPNAATAIQGNATGSTGAVVGTLAAAAAKTTYLCDFDVTALGTASSVGPIVIAGLLGGSKTYQMGTLATGTQQLLTKNFNPCLPGSATNTAITITTTADATATAVDVNSSGFQQ